MNKIKKYNIKIFKKIDEDLITSWNKLWKIAENANFFNSYQRFLLCVETYKIKNFNIQACYTNNKLIALLPLHTYSVFGVKVSGSIGNKSIGNSTFLFEKYDQELFRVFFDSFVTENNSHIMRIDGKAVEMMHKLFPALFFSLNAVVPYLELAEDPLRFVNQSSLKKVRNILKKNSDKFCLRIYDHKDNLKKYLETMFAIEQKSSKKLRSKDLFSKNESRVYYRNLIKFCRKNINIAFLYYQDKPIAYSLNIVYGNVFRGSQTSYLHEYKRFAPGKIIALKLLESLKDTSFQTFDFGPGISSFKQELTPQYYFLYDCYFSKSILVMGWWRLINTIRRLKKILVPEKFTKDREFLFKTL